MYPDVALPRVSLFQVPCRQYVIRPSWRPCEETGDLSPARRRGNQTLQKTPPRLSRPQTSSPRVCCAFKGNVLIIRAFAARAVKIPQRLLIQIFQLFRVASPPHSSLGGFPLCPFQVRPPRPHVVKRPKSNVAVEGRRTSVSSPEQ